MQEVPPNVISDPHHQNSLQLQQNQPPNSTTQSLATKPVVTNGYITVAEANQMLLKEDASLSSDPRAYSKVAIAPADLQLPVRITRPSSNEEVSPLTSNTLVMSAKDLQVETRPPFKKVVTTLDDGSSATKSTMV